ncbi:hypothetical protein AbraIFM66950_008584 [Aspergillus brasiliensis]|nr:hypothetical protein AbraIFM66950_008584 [Aspergillus brasiliensis]
MDPRLVTGRRSKRFLPKKRLRKLLRNNIDGITRPSIRRLARRGGVIRIGAGVYPEVRKTVKNRLTEIMRQIILVMESSTTPSRERKLVTTRDVSSRYIV